MKRTLSVMMVISILSAFFSGNIAFAEAEELISPTDFIENQVTVGADRGTVSNITLDNSEEALKLTCTTAGTKTTDFGVKCDISGAISSGDATHLCFSAASDGGSAQLTAALVINGSTIKSNKFFITPQICDYYFPIKATATQTNAYIIFSIGELEQSVIISDVSFKNYKTSESIEKNNTTLKSGAWMRESEEWKDYSIESDDAVLNSDGSDIIKSSIDVCSNDDYLYVLSNYDSDRTMQVWSVANPDAPVYIGKSEELGLVRQIEYIKDRNAVFVTCRGDGAYIIDVSNPENPEIISHYNSVEMATGICVYGNWAAVTNRVFGTEILDISDLRNPRHLMYIRTGEAQSCSIVDGYLYAGIWGEKKVKIYNLANLETATQSVAEISLNGYGDGIFIKDGYLYAATGHSSSGSSTAEIGFGMGGGMEIYDVSDPSNPVWCSTCKLDGRLFYRSNDMWRVEMAKNGDSYYAYLVDMYHGVYVFDVTDAKQPIRVAHIKVVADLGERGYTTALSPTDKVFPFDVSQCMQMPVDGMAVANGKLFLADGSGLHSFNVPEGDRNFVTEQILNEYNSDKNVNYENGGSTDIDFYSKDLPVLEKKFSGAKRYNPGSQVTAAVYNNGYTYVAAGQKGIHVLDKNLNVVDIETDGVDIAYDVKIHGNTLYAANGWNGVSTYSINSDGTLTKTSAEAYISKRYGKRLTVKQIVLSPNANFGVIHAGDQDIDMVDFRTPGTIKRWAKSGTNNIIHTSGLMYNKQISPLIDNRYIAGWGYNSNVYLVDFGQDNGNEPDFWDTKIDHEMGQDGLLIPSSQSGTDVLMFNNGGYSKVDILGTSITYVNKTVNFINIKDDSGNIVNVEAKASQNGDFIFADGRMSGDCYIINAKDVSNPVVISQFNLTGHADIAYATPDNMYLSAGYEGLFVLPISTLLEEPPEKESETEYPSKSYGLLKDGFDVDTVSESWETYNVTSTTDESKLPKMSISNGKLKMTTGSIGNSRCNAGQIGIFDKKVPLTKAGESLPNSIKLGPNAKLYAEYTLDLTDFAKTTIDRTVYTGLSNAEKTIGKDGMIFGVSYQNPVKCPTLGHFEYSKDTSVHNINLLSDDTLIEPGTSRIKLEVAITDKNGNYYAGEPKVNAYYKSSQTNGEWVHCDAYDLEPLISGQDYIDRIMFSSTASGTALYLDNVLVYVKEGNTLSYEIADNTVTVVSNEAYSDACVALVAYNEGRLEKVSLYKGNITEGNNTISIPDGFVTAQTDNIKAMWLENDYSLKPICKCYNSEVNNQ